MRKITEDVENPIDNFIYIFVSYLAPHFHKWGFTPNMLTTISIAFTGIAVYSLLQHSFVLSAIFYSISYLFDCLDGYVARKYNMVTAFGDWYDHISDTLKVAFYCGTLLYINTKLFLLFFPISVYILCIVNYHMLYQEVLYDKKSESQTLQFFFQLMKHGNISKSEAKTNMKYSRYFGCGTFQLFLVLVTLVYANFYSSDA
jgi:phosphatidylglycerophosphate synthase